MIKVKLLTVAAVVAALGSPASARGADYTDRGGDNGADADIGVVSVFHGGDGYLHVKLNVANMPPPLSSGSVIVGFDTDRNPATGELGGSDFLITVSLEDLSGFFTKWNGAEYADADVPQGALRYLVGAGGIEFLIRPSLLGDARSFGFLAGVASGDIGEGRIDLAPDTGTWIFEQAVPLTVEEIDAKFVPAQPRAGARFQPTLVRIKLSNGKYVVAGSYRCVVTLGGKLLRGTGRGGCTLKLPEDAKGKRLLVTFFVTYAGNTDEFDPYSFKVR